MMTGCSTCSRCDNWRSHITLTPDSEHGICQETGAMTLGSKDNCRCYAALTETQCYYATEARDDWHYYNACLHPDAKASDHPARCRPYPDNGVLCPLGLPPRRYWYCQRQQEPLEAESQEDIENSYLCPECKLYKQGCRPQECDEDGDLIDYYAELANRTRSLGQATLEGWA